MTRRRTKELQKAFNHFADGGDLYHALTPDKWVKQIDLYIRSTSPSVNIIADEHFEARKAYALGEEIEFSYDRVKWYGIAKPFFITNDKKYYRPKPKEPVYKVGDEVIIKGYETVFTVSRVVNDQELFVVGEWNIHICDMNKTTIDMLSKTIYEWQWVYKCSRRSSYDITITYHTEDEAMDDWTKFEPSKRLRKQND